MIKDSITMSENAFLALLELLNCTVKSQLAISLGQGNESMKQFLEGREELCEKGWAELDFDGSIHPTARFARMTYTLPRVIASMCFEKDGVCEWYLRGPIELLHVERSPEGYTFIMCGTDELVTWVKEILYPAETGSLVTQCGDQKLETEFLPAEKVQKARADVLAEHLCMYFEKEATHA